MALLVVTLPLYLLSLGIPGVAEQRSTLQVIIDLYNYETVLILIDLFQNHILFCKYLSPLTSHRNGFVFKIWVWISVQEKKLKENPILGCRNIKQIFFQDTLYIEGNKLG